MVNDSSSIVQVIHCGSEQDINTLETLKQMVQKCDHPSNKLDFQHATFREEQKHNRSTLIHMEIEKHKKANSFVVVFISRTLFEVMWSSLHKRTFLKMITSIKNCLHIWLDVNEEIVRRYSTILPRKDLRFGRINIEELSGNAEDKISTLYTLLHASRRIRVNYQQNYSVDDELVKL